MPRDPNFAEGFKNAPYWWDARDARPEPSDTALPASIDVVVIGAGVTGVEAARVLAEGGRSVLVLDVGHPGEGASTRNAAQIGRNFKHPYSALKASHGQAFARGVFGELQEAFDAVAALGASHAEAIGWRVSGRVVGAMSAMHNDKLQREYALRASELGETIVPLDRDAIRAEMNGAYYEGGILLPNNGMVHAGLYHQFLERRARVAGARIEGSAPVTALSRERDGSFRVETPRGRIRARDVLAATNGYTGRVLPMLAKRLLPIRSTMIATEPLAPNLGAAILGRWRTYHDNRKRSHYFTVSADGTRILMGGRTNALTFDETALLRTLHGDMLNIFPQLEGTRLSHGWSGRCAAPMDVFPRFGVIEGVHYALGYSFSGMAMGPHLARKVAALMLGRHEDARSHFARPTFPVYPLPARGPWTVATMLGWQNWRERPKTFTRRM